MMHHGQGLSYIIIMQESRALLKWLSYTLLLQQVISESESLQHAQYVQICITLQMVTQLRQSYGITTMLV
jgi:hypothetical protein